MHFPPFRLPVIRQVWNFIQQGNYAFSIDLKDANLQIPIFKHQPNFYG